VDRAYETGANYECSKPICCRAYTENDAPGKTSFPCGPYGHPKCDPPLRLEESMMAAIAAMDPAFSIYTGDVVPHDVWSVNQTEVLHDLNATYSLLDQLGLVYAALGNHDTAPVNLFPSERIPVSHNPQWAYDALAEDWTNLVGGALSAPVVHATDQFGSYSAIHPGGKLRIISYNSVFYYTYNFYAYQEPMEYDPNGQLAWLISELQAAETAGQRVWLIAHIPTGGTDTLHDYSHYLDQIIQRYDATIAALFQVSYADPAHPSADSASAVGFITPSLTPTSGPPAFRIYDIDPVTFAVLDYTVYTANISTETNPEWTKYYSAKESYGSLLSPPLTDPTAELTPAFWHNVTALMETDNSVFQAWWARTTRGFNVPECNAQCARDQICSLRAADAQYGCVRGTLSITKRDGLNLGGAAPAPAPGSHVHVHSARPQCEEGGLARVLAAVIRETDDLQGLLLQRAELYI
jgi:sphingomyelin phosphodiesterase